MAIKQRFGLTTFSLKILGLILMVIDHFHEFFASFGVPAWVDWFGRPVPIIFFFVSVEGFTHTRNKRLYLTRLLIGFWLMNLGNTIVQHFFQLRGQAITNNIFADLFLGVLTMLGIYFFEQKRPLLGISVLLAPLLTTAIAALLILMKAGIVAQIFLGVVPTILFAEYFVLFYLAGILYVFRNKRTIQLIAIAIVAFLYLLLGMSQWIMVFAIIPIYLYNGLKGGSLKYFFYVFYPLHIWALYIIASLMAQH
ncbi:TraX family protein [Furfurilactobacillus entadae]|uniref:TraX family protein n=1 Tax=Furfurilactobacillus entadae TaxID=2922307 RepID=UPI0035EEE609